MSVTIPTRINDFQSLLQSSLWEGPMTGAVSGAELERLTATIEADLAQLASGPERVEYLSGVTVALNELRRAAQTAPADERAALLEGHARLTSFVQAQRSAAAQGVDGVETTARRQPEPQATSALLGGLAPARAGNALNLPGNPTRLRSDRTLQRELADGRVTVSAGGTLEAAAQVRDQRRMSGGNEDSYGDYTLLGSASVRYGLTERWSVGVDLDAATNVWNYGDTREQNYHNRDRFRHDGLLSRPALLGRLSAERAGERHDVSLWLGSARVTGLDPLDPGAPLASDAQLAPHVLATHYDKGLGLAYAWRPDGGRQPVASLSVAVTDGDWMVGDASVDTARGSRANSYPGGAAQASLDLVGLVSPAARDRIGGLEIGGFWGGSNSGSNPGQKFHDRDYVGFAAYRSPELWRGARLALRYSAGIAEHGRTWYDSAAVSPTGSIKGKPPEETRWQAGEAAVSGVQLGRLGAANLSAGIYEMRHESGDPAGAVEGLWPTTGGIASESGWRVGASLSEAFGVPQLTLGATYGRNLTYDRDGNVKYAWPGSFAGKDDYDAYSSLYARWEF